MGEYDSRRYYDEDDEDDDSPGDYLSNCSEEEDSNNEDGKQKGEEPFRLLKYEVSIAEIDRAVADIVRIVTHDIQKTVSIIPVVTSQQSSSSSSSQDKEEERDGTPFKITSTSHRRSELTF